MNKLIDKIALPALGVFFGNIFLLVGGKIIKKDWQGWYKLVPDWILFIIFGVLVLWIIIGIIRRRLNTLNAPVRSGHIIISTPVFGYSKIGRLNYKNVKWRVLYPIENSWDLNPKITDAEQIVVKSTPYCPNCEDMELTERKTFWGNFRWSCLKCGYHRTNKNSSEYESENDVLKIAKSEAFKT